MVWRGRTGNVMDNVSSVGVITIQPPPWRLHRDEIAHRKLKAQDEPGLAGPSRSRAGCVTIRPVQQRHGRALDANGRNISAAGGCGQRAGVGGGTTPSSSPVSQPARPASVT